MNYFLSLDITGYILSHDLPHEAIQDCSRPGPVDENVRYWVNRLSFEADEVKAAEYLLSLGGWSSDELTDHEANLERLLWLVCCDLKESSKN